MRIYLLKDLKGHGRAGEIVTLNDGYAKNFVMKNKIGRQADKQAEAEIKSKKESADFKLEQEIAEIKAVIEKLKTVTVHIKARVGANGKLFGAITSTELAAELAAAGIQTDKRNIDLPEPLRAEGAYKICVKFAHNLHGEFNAIVENADGK
jgi:large subunit ribosomal protein L9